MTGIDISTAITILKPLVTLLYQNSKQVGNLLNKDVGQIAQDLLTSPLHKYVDRYNSRHCQFKFFDMSKPVALESVYTKVTFLDGRDIKSFRTKEFLEKKYYDSRSSNERSLVSRDFPRLEGIQVANDIPCLMVLGGPGSGKSTFLQRMGQEVLSGKREVWKHDCIPVFIELKNLTSSDIDIKNIISKEFEICGFPNHDSLTESSLEKGSLLILLDGLDELPEGCISDIVSKIKDFVDQYKKNRFIISSRMTNYYNIPQFTDVRLADFNDKQIEEYIHKWFLNDDEAGQQCWEVLSDSEHETAKELAHTPLLLTFLCLVYERQASFPSNRSSLYESVVKILLQEWGAHKQIKDKGKKTPKGLDIESEESLLSELAYDNFVKEQLFFDKNELLDFINKFLAKSINSPRQLDAKVILDIISIHHGILVEQSNGVFSFSHLTIQEYFTAKYIKDYNHTDELVTNYLTNQRWQEVFLLVAGKMRGNAADELLKKMHEQAQRCINSSNLIELLQRAENFTSNSDSNYQPLAKQTVTIAVALTHILTCNNTLNLASNIALDIALDLVPKVSSNEALDRAINIAKDLAAHIGTIPIYKNVDFTTLITELEAMRNVVPGDRVSLKVKREFRSKIFETWCNAIKLKLEPIILSDQELQSLKNYLYADLLIVRCKDLAARVSPQTWQEIEAQMLRSSKSF